MSDDEVIALQPCPFCEKLFGVGTPLIQHVATHEELASPPPTQVTTLSIAYGSKVTELSIPFGSHAT